MGKKIKAFINRTFLLAVCMMFLSCNMLTAFAADEPLYGGHTAAEWQDEAKYLFEVLILNTSQEEKEQMMEYCRQSGMESVVSMYEYWFANESAVGGFVDYGDFNVTENNGVIHAVQVVTYENKKLEFELVDDAELEVRDFYLREHVEVQQSLSDVMAKAGMNTLMGVGTVFVVLALMIILISLFKYVNAFETALTKKAEDKQETPDFVEQISQRESVEQNVPVTADTELIAVIAAAIAAATGDDTDSFVVRSIKRR